MSRKSGRIASLPQKTHTEVDSDEDVEEEEVEVKPAKGKKRAAPKADKKGKAKAADVSDEEEEEAKPKGKKAKTEAPSADTSNASITLAGAAESAKGSRSLKNMLTIDPSTTTTTVVTPGGSSVTIKELESAHFEKHFDEIADALLNKSIMFIAGLPHRLLEVEFYCNGHKHVDDFAHGNERQKTRAQWYFHMKGSGYKGGSFKGLDVTFGDEGFYGGILLRALQPLYGDFQPVEGPSLLVDHVLKLTGSTKIEDLVGKFDMLAEVDLEKEDLAKPKHPLFLVHSDKEFTGVPKQVVYKGARVGLSMKVFSDGKQNYVGKFYRYMITPDKIKKGRHYFVVSMYQQGYDAKKIVEITKSTNASVSKLIELYNGGKNKDYKKYTNVELSTNEVCEMIGSCAGFCYPVAK